MKGRGTAGCVWLTVLIALLGSGHPVAAQQAPAPKTGPSIDGEYGYGLPPAVYKHEHGRRIDTLIRVLNWFTVAVLTSWSAFVVYCLVRFRKRSGHRAAYEAGWKHAHLYFVLGIAVFELVLDVGLSNPVLAGAKNRLPTDRDNPQRVRVVAEQFSWNFHYPGPDDVFGKTGPQYIDTATNPLGLDPNDPSGDDDLLSGELHIVIDRPVLVQLTSKDVIHSFSVPVLRVKQDVIPGMRIPVWFEAGRTGNYEVACAQLCGNNHYSMRALMVVHGTQRELDEWLESQRPEEFDEDEFED